MLKLIIFLLTINVAIVTFWVNSLAKKIRILTVVCIDFEDKIEEIEESCEDAKEMMEKVHEINSDIIKQLKTITKK